MLDGTASAVSSSAIASLVDEIDSPGLCTPRVLVATPALASSSSLPPAGSSSLPRPARADVCADGGRVDDCRGRCRSAQARCRRRHRGARACAGRAARRHGVCAADVPCGLASSQPTWGPEADTAPTPPAQVRRALARSMCPGGRAGARSVGSVHRECRNANADALAFAGAAEGVLRAPLCALRGHRVRDACGTASGSRGTLDRDVAARAQ